MLALEGVYSLDVLFKVLIDGVVLIAAVVRALEGSGVCVGVEVITETGWSVKGFVAAGPCAL